MVKVSCIGRRASCRLCQQHGFHRGLFSLSNELLQQITLRISPKTNQGRLYPVQYDTGNSPDFSGNEGSFRLCTVRHRQSEFVASSCTYSIVSVSSELEILFDFLENRCVFSCKTSIYRCFSRKKRIDFQKSEQISSSEETRTILHNDDFRTLHCEPRSSRWSKKIHRKKTKQKTKQKLISRTSPRGRVIKTLCS